MRVAVLGAGTMGGGGCWSCHGVASGSTTEVGAVDPLRTLTCSYCHHTVEEQAAGLTPAGEQVRATVFRQMGQPPPEIAALPLRHQRALRDALRAACGRESASRAPAA